jgi:hypothetical protein
MHVPQQSRPERLELVCKEYALLHYQPDATYAPIYPAHTANIFHQNIITDVSELSNTHDLHPGL